MKKWRDRCTALAKEKGKQDKSKAQGSHKYKAADSFHTIDEDSAPVFKAIKGDVEKDLIPTSNVGDVQADYPARAVLMIDKADEVKAFAEIGQNKTMVKWESKEVGSGDDQDYSDNL